MERETVIEKSPRITGPRKALTGALVMSSLAIAGGCDSNTDSRTVDEMARDAICRLMASTDSDCDTVKNEYDKYPGFNDLVFDMDKDGIADAYDAYYGDNTGDFDRDGVANGYDINPYDPRITFSPEVVAVLEQQQREREIEEHNKKMQEELEQLEEENLSMQIYLDYLDRQSRDSDNDRVSDLMDTKPFLDDREDHDRDGYSTGRDRFPLDDDDY